MVSPQIWRFELEILFFGKLRRRLEQENVPHCQGELRMILGALADSKTSYLIMIFEKPAANKKLHSRSSMGLYRVVHKFW